MDGGRVMINILYEDNHVLGVVKPANLPVQADNTKDEDLLTLVKQYLKEKYNKPGNVYLGLVHRLDRPVGGTMILAKTSKAASRLSESIRVRDIDKVYYAILDGVPKKQSDTLVDYLTKDTKTNMVSVTNAKVGKKSILHYQVLATKNGHTLVEIHLETGRPHQIRVQFASRNLPLVGDQRYNKNAKKVQIALWAVSLTFPHPTTKDKITIHSDPPEIWPWTEFEVKLWQK